MLCVHNERPERQCLSPVPGPRVGHVELPAQEEGSGSWEGSGSCHSTAASFGIITIAPGSHSEAQLPLRTLLCLRPYAPTSTCKLKTSAKECRMVSFHFCQQRTGEGVR